MAGFLPVIPSLERAFGINQDVGDILRITYFVVSFPDLEQRIVGRAGWIGRIEQEHGPKPRTPAGGQLEILSLDVVDDRGIGPSQQGWNDETDALPGPCRRKAQHVFRTIMPEIAATEASEPPAVRPEKSCPPNLSRFGPSRRAIRCNVLSFFRPPDR